MGNPLSCHNIFKRNNIDLSDPTFTSERKIL